MLFIAFLQDPSLEGSTREGAPETMKTRAALSDSLREQRLGQDRPQGPALPSCLPSCPVSQGSHGLPHSAWTRGCESAVRVPSSSADSCCNLFLAGGGRGRRQPQPGAWPRGSGAGRVQGCRSPLGQPPPLRTGSGSLFTSGKVQNCLSGWSRPRRRGFKKAWRNLSQAQISLGRGEGWARPGQMGFPRIAVLEGRRNQGGQEEGCQGERPWCLGMGTLGGRSLSSVSRCSHHLLPALNLDLPVRLLRGTCSATQSWPSLCDPMGCSTPGFPVLRRLPELAQTHVHAVGDAIQLSRPLWSPGKDKKQQKKGMTEDEGDWLKGKTTGSASPSVLFWEIHSSHPQPQPVRSPSFPLQSVEDASWSLAVRAPWPSCCFFSRVSWALGTPRLLALCEWERSPLPETSVIQVLISGMEIVIPRVRPPLVPHHFHIGTLYSAWVPASLQQAGKRGGWRRVRLDTTFGGKFIALKPLPNCCLEAAPKRCSAALRLPGNLWKIQTQISIRKVRDKL